MTSLAEAITQEVRRRNLLPTSCWPYLYHLNLFFLPPPRHSSFSSSPSRPAATPSTRRLPCGSADPAGCSGRSVPLYIITLHQNSADVRSDVGQWFLTEDALLSDKLPVSAIHKKWKSGYSQSLYWYEGMKDSLHHPWTPPKAQCSAVGHVNVRR